MKKEANNKKSYRLQGNMNMSLLRRRYKSNKDIYNFGQGNK